MTIDNSQLLIVNSKLVLTPIRSKLMHSRSADPCIRFIRVVLLVLDRL
ncbi:MAG: hypothetical protein ACRC62_18905 [Microcoleus sp.]